MICKEPFFETDIGLGEEVLRLKENSRILYKGFDITNDIVELAKSGFFDKFIPNKFIN